MPGTLHLRVVEKVVLVLSFGIELLAIQYHCQRSLS